MGGDFLVKVIFIIEVMDGGVWIGWVDIFGGLFITLCFMFVGIWGVVCYFSSIDLVVLGVEVVLGNIYYLMF